jgi:hypothetical protein
LDTFPLTTTQLLLELYYVIYGATNFAIANAKEATISNTNKRELCEPSQHRQRNQPIGSIVRTKS